MNENLDTISWKVYDYAQLDPSVKWKSYYGDLKVNLHLRPHAQLVTFSQFANARRGVATGANNFFTLSEAEVGDFGIGEDFLVPCLTRASHATYHIFGEEEFAELRAAGKKIYLLYLNGKELTPAVQAYIAKGEAEGQHAGYLTRNRAPWYSMEPATPADFLVKTFARGRAVFIENRLPAINLTCFHGIYLTEIGHAYRESLFFYLLTDLALEIFEGQKREYGSGLGKFEPNDIKNAKMLDLTLVEDRDLARLAELYQTYSQTYRLSPSSADNVIVQAEEIFTNYFAR